MTCPKCHHTFQPATADLGRELAKRGATKSGRPRTKPRCKCGAMTLERAAKRKHKC